MRTIHERQTHEKRVHEKQIHGALWCEIQAELLPCQKYRGTHANCAQTKLPARTPGVSLLSLRTLPDNYFTASTLSSMLTSLPTTRPVESKTTW